MGSTLAFRPCFEEHIEKLSDLFAEALGPDDGWTVTPLAQTIRVERRGATWRWRISTAEMDLASIIGDGDPSRAFHAAWIAASTAAKTCRQAPVLFTHHEGVWWMWTTSDICDAPTRVQLHLGVNAVHGLPVTADTLSALAWS